MPLADPAGHLAARRRRVATYPEALRTAVVRDALWQVEFGLEPFARKFAARGDAYGAVGCLTRAAWHLVLALFALNRTYLLNDKTALEEIAGFARAPVDFGARLQAILSAPGTAPDALGRAVSAIAGLAAETVALTDGLYRGRHRP